MKKKVVKKLLIVSLAPTIKKDNRFYSYAPYVNEMDIWFKYANEHRILAPFYYPEEVLSKPFETKTIERYYIPFIAFNKLAYIIKSVLVLPVVIFQMLRAMAWADHIHFRCPSNVCLIASFVQILFPHKSKSTKYAGNWDPNSNQPWTYRLQQSILRNTYVTRNMKVLVYGVWPNETSNIKPFISATYYDSEKVPFLSKSYEDKLNFVYAGMLVPGKRPLLTIQVIESLYLKGYQVHLDLFGDGPLMNEISEYVEKNNLKSVVSIHGNKHRDVVKKKLMTSHFNILLSKSEGWPKAVAEGMFFGCVPITTRVSCVGWMVGEGSRGIIIEPNLDEAVNTIVNYLKTENLDSMAQEALEWSQQYTFDRLEEDIQKVLKGNYEKM